MAKSRFAPTAPQTELSQHLLEHDLLRCRYLLTRAATTRLGLRDLANISEHRERFLAECHAAFKKAQHLLIENALAIERYTATLPKEKPGNSILQRKLAHWARVIALFYDSFIWIAAGHDRSSATKVYKGPKYGNLTDQNIDSVLQLTTTMNAEPQQFAIPLDFSRFACVCDLLLLTTTEGQGTTTFIEVKEGTANAALFQAKEQNTIDAYLAYITEYGEKGIKQAERCFRQEKALHERTNIFRAPPGTYHQGDEVHTVLQPNVEYKYFHETIEELLKNARNGEYAAELIDHCLVVAALDTSARERHALAEYNARVLAYEAFLRNHATPLPDTDDLVNELTKIPFTDWLEGMGSIFLTPPPLGPLGSRSLFDLLFGRIRLLAHFDAPRFLAHCRAAGIEAGFISKRRTNQLKGAGRLKDYPIHNGRALGYLANQRSMIMGSAKIHEMLYNWVRPQAIIQELAVTIELLKHAEQDHEAHLTPAYATSDLEFP